MNINSATSTPRWHKRLAAGLMIALTTLPLLSVAGDELPVPPVLEAKRLDGSRYSLADSRGAVAVVVVWSPDSLASRKSLGELQRFTAEHPPSEVAVIAISTTDDAARLRQFAEERQLDLPLATLETTNLGPFPEPGLPQIHVFRRDGSLHASHGGLFRLQTLEAMVAPLLRGNP